MHTAPSVSYPVGPGRSLRVVLFLLCGVSGGGLLYLGDQTGFAGWQPIVVSLSWVLACGVALHFWRHLPRGRIHWDGRAWYWELPASDLPGQLQVGIDGQAVMLLRWQARPDHDGTDASAWMWVERAGGPDDWLALRRAVYSRPHPPSSA
jgi:toxin CptA